MVIMKRLGNWSIAAGLALVLVLGASCGTGGANDSKGGSPGGMGAGKAGRRGGPGMFKMVNIQTTNAQNLGNYDYGSIMHYPTWGFSSNGLPTSFMNSRISG